MTRFLGGLTAAGFALVLGAVAFSAALLSFGDDDRDAANPAGEVDCILETCLSRAEVEALTGFAPLEPASLPSGYLLFDRRVPLDEIPPEARQRIAEVQGVPLDDVPVSAPPRTVILEYRFLGRPHVPAINIIQIKDDSGGSIEIHLEQDDCGEEVQLDGRTVLYGEGAGSLTRSEGEPWMACPSAGEGALGNVVFSDGAIAVELKVPLENLSRSDALDLARSM